MASLENVYHDFPRLAKQSGFHFQLHRGKVNWAEIENLAIEEITESRNFQLLERNLQNVINCNLEREYDLKILDQNFIKLFKLAQLGVDYLFYCEMYLDRCVVLLQEQLNGLQEECESLKQGNQKMKNSTKNKIRNKIINYQCEKCEKVFISDVYLKYHEKRRHSTAIILESMERSHMKSTDSSQQTEEERKFSVSTQTVFFDEVTTTIQMQNESTPKVPLVTKIENLEQELHGLKERLKKAESTFLDRTEVVKPSESHVFNLPNSMQYNSMVMLLPSYVSQSGNGFYEINPRCQVSIPETRQTNNMASPPSIHSEMTESKPSAGNLSKANIKSEKLLGSVCQLGKEDTNFITFAECIKSFQDYQSEEKESPEYNKENMDPNMKPIIVRKPLPPPRRSRKRTCIQCDGEDTVTIKPLEVAKSPDPNEKVAFNCHSIVNNSTPINEMPDGETISKILGGFRENFSEINEQVASSNESLANKKSIAVEPESKSFIQKIVTRNSPKLQKLSKNIRKSLTNLYDSVFFTEKDPTKKDLSNQESKTATVDALNNQLRRLGVDPEWTGIPKKTMKQKLNALKYRRKFLSKENSMYPVVRQNVEDQFFQKLQKKLKKKKTVLRGKWHKQESPNNKSSTFQDPSEDGPENKVEFFKTKNFAMYENDSDSDSKTSDSENNFNRDTETLQKNVAVEDLISSGITEEKVDTKNSGEFDVSVFQIRRGSLENISESMNHKFMSVDKIDYVSTDSDFEGDLVTNLNDKGFIMHKENSDYKSKDGKTALDKSRDCRALKFFRTKKETIENSVFTQKNALEYKITTNAKKRVIFDNYPSGFEELSDGMTNDDFWSLKSEWAKEAR